MMLTVTVDPPTKLTAGDATTVNCSKSSTIKSLIIGNRAHCWVGGWPGGLGCDPAPKVMNTLVPPKSPVEKLIPCLHVNCKRR